MERDKTITKAEKVRNMCQNVAFFTLWQCYNSMFSAVWPYIALKVAVSRRNVIAVQLMILLGHLTLSVKILFLAFNNGVDVETRFF